MTSRTICLCMIVKNEINILKRCFDSVVKYIDYWVICDTGSTDGTQDFIKKYFSKKKIKGKLYEHKWVDFAHNRTLAFQKAKKSKAKYSFVIDADDILVGNLVIPPGDSILDIRLKINLGNLEYWRSQIFRNDLDWKYVGVVHEYPCLVNQNDAKKYNRCNLSGCKIQAGTFGNRSKDISSKFERDILLLKKGLEDEPKNERYHFYLAQSYKDNKNYEEAIVWYIKRVELGGWCEEVYYSLYSIGCCKECAGYDFENEVLYDYLRAFNFRKMRLEALYRIVHYYRINRKFTQAFGYGIMGYKVKFPKDQLFVDKDVHEYKFIDELSIVAYWVGFYKLSYDLCKKIINDKYYHEAEKDRIYKNLDWSIQKLKKDKKELIVKREGGIIKNESKLYIICDINILQYFIEYINSILYKIDRRFVEMILVDKHCIYEWFYSQLESDDINHNIYIFLKEDYDIIELLDSYNGNNIFIINTEQLSRNNCCKKINKLRMAKCKIIDYSLENCSIINDSIYLPYQVNDFEIYNYDKVNDICFVGNCGE